MKVFPLECIDLEKAKSKQFHLIDVITKHFRGNEILQTGDLGLVTGIYKPSVTAKVEEVLADFFGAEAAVLVRGSGTAAIRWALYAMVRPGETLLVHDAPLYPTTAVTAENMGIQLLKVDFNDIDAVSSILEKQGIKAALVQHARQKPDDSYSLSEVTAMIKRKDIPVLTDDNYAVMRVNKIGVECGADISTFSTFKLLGPEGVGCVVGKKEYIDKIVAANYSGGGQIQGHEAMACMRGMVYAPVAMAIQGQVVDEVCHRLNAGEIKGIRQAIIVNAQSKVLLVEFMEDIAKSVLQMAEKLGAAPYPVGSESKYEFVPMFYRISGTFRAADPSLEKRMIRINPMRSGADTIIRILKEAMTIK